MAAFWPYGVLLSVRVHNDVLVTTLMTASIYFMIKWSEDNDLRSFWLALVGCALSVLTKANGIVVVACFVILVSSQLVRRTTRRMSLVRALGSAALLTIACVASAWNKLAADRTSPCFNVLGGACASIAGVTGEGLRVANGPSAYLGFDLRSFLTEPFVDVNRPGSSTRYFFNHLLKGSLFGTYINLPDPEIGGPLNQQLARAFNVCLLSMLLLTVYGVTQVPFRHLGRYHVLMLTGVLFVAFLAGFRAVIPNAFHVDFRFVFPLLLTGVVAFSKVLEHLRKQGSGLYHFGIGLVLVMAALTIAFFVPK
jgi:4-amino-4-deoxy-L-arabinose transferase-like glycosyltransferase